MNDDNQYGPVIGSGAPKQRRKMWLILGGMVGALLLAGGAAAWWLNAGQQPEEKKEAPKHAKVVEGVAENACSDAIIKEANGPLEELDVAALAEIVAKFTETKGYDRDPDCLYIALQYYIAQGDAELSQEMLSKYEQYYNPAVGLDSAFTGRIVTLSVLRENVAFLVENQKGIEAFSQQGEESIVSGSQKADEIYRQRQEQ